MKLKLILALALTLQTLSFAQDKSVDKQDIVFEDFEKENFGNWVLDGECFGDAPAKVKYHHQKFPAALQGKGFANSFYKREVGIGSLTSPEFEIDRKYITFLIGGGVFDLTALQLLIDGEVVLTKSGLKNWDFAPAYFDVSKYIGKKAQLRIIDNDFCGWGYIIVDNIVFTDKKPAFENKEFVSPWNIGAASGKVYNPFNIPSDYKEDFRQQFHFSPKNEWMNDINALIYHNGIYHMIYQWGDKVRHGGYTTSKDLLHWDNKGVALMPINTFLKDEATPNVSGRDVYSGSGVYVEGEAAEKITGSKKPALIAIYTGTTLGTCLAWSNDDGETWNNYHSNPVANESTTSMLRDPCVIWHEATQKWVLAIFYQKIFSKTQRENYTQFFGSKDLINWDFLSQIKFGYECPDFVELPLDGDKDNKKWVLYDAVGSYLVGEFDGTNFVDENKSDTENLLDKGPDFYAGQTFFPHNLPEKKYIQIAWMDRWNGGVGETKWGRNATFPVELGLVSKDGQMLVTREPINAIKKLYVGKPFELSNKTLSSKNVLEEVKSKTFDATMVFDLSKTTATKITLQIADKKYIYDIQKQNLIYIDLKGEPAEVSLKPNSEGILKIRMLVDWASVEMFSENGLFSFTQHIGFDPKSSDLSLTSDGKVKLIELKLNKIKSIW